ncbi:rhamnosyltransferase [Nitrosococcus halophilus Nc 4]|uniref:Rhamnosyltransferase n=1 Tax=Nitrosococcus halophilus (strain Nc4) TaxID=472759 RepID=D5C265_NITHN|nr:glycosyltransferase family 2 protein [Nitrosococcus halophilus]ADE16653.1 rhamnosyltransferase [Nitrosococcus halophilus Nc 4]
MEREKNYCCIAVIITYQPDLEGLERLLFAVSPQVEAVVVVDNASGGNIPQWLKQRGVANLHCLALPENLGVAAAQNRGIAWAKERSATHVVLFDQDSCPAPDMIERLYGAWKQLEQRGRRVCALGPAYQDRRRPQSQPFVRVRGLMIGRCHCQRDDEILEVDHLISSGSLIPMAVLDKVGGMVEALFIDYIDIEWILRARQRGYQAYGVCGAKMFHTLGEEPIRFLGREVVARSPLRHYYLFRNAIWIYRQDWIPPLWKLADGFRLWQRFFFYALFAPPRLRQLKMMTLGLWHGLWGRMGRYGAVE